MEDTKFFKIYKLDSLIEQPTSTSTFTLAEGTNIPLNDIESMYINSDKLVLVKKTSSLIQFLTYVLNTNLTITQDGSNTYDLSRYFNSNIIDDGIISNLLILFLHN